MAPGKLHNFMRNDSGSFAILSAAAIMMLVSVSALAIDVTRIIHYKRLIADAADSAVLAGVSEGSRSRKYAEQFSGNGPIPPGSEDVNNLFRVNFIDQKQADFQFIHVQADARRIDSKIEAALDYEIKVRTIFGEILGIDTVTLTGSTAATWEQPKPVDYYLLLDNTPSMGIGATLEDISILEEDPIVTQLGGRKCAFACHTTEEVPIGQEGNTYKRARELGVTLRTDVVREAASKLLDTARSTQLFPGQFRFAAYSFGEINTAGTLTEISALSANYSQKHNELQQYQLMQAKPNGVVEDHYPSRFDIIFGQLSTIIARNEKDFDSDDPERIIFFVSDGILEEARANFPNCEKGSAPDDCRQPIDPASCQSLKMNGVKIAALYTTYVPIDDPWVQNEFLKWSHEVPERMKACASPGLFFEVGPHEGISEAMTELFKRTLSRPRLTGVRS